MRQPYNGKPVIPTRMAAHLLNGGKVEVAICTRTPATAEEARSDCIAKGLIGLKGGTLRVDAPTGRYIYAMFALWKDKAIQMTHWTEENIRARDYFDLSPFDIRDSH